MNLISRTTAITFLMTVIAVSSFAQTTEFSYQGSLQNSSAPATGNFDFEFALFDSLTGGLQLGTTLTRSSVAVANGTFAVKLDFGGQFPGANRFLEIRVRQAGGGAFTPLSPRQSVASTPYALQSLNATNATTANSATNATQLGGVAANQYVVTTDPRMTDARPPTSGSSDYIQNGTSTQASSNFNISGNGTVGGTLSSNIVSAATQYNIGSNRILSDAGNFNLFAGVGTGDANTNGFNNSFFGASSGSANTTGFSNSFYGRDSGLANTTGGENSFFGRNSGRANTTGFNNSFFGRISGFANTTGGNNSFFGVRSGFSNTTGSNNTIIGDSADVSVEDLNFATAIGSGAVVTTSNTVVLGRPVDTVAFPGKFVATSTGIGIFTTAPTTALDITDNGGTIIFGGAGCPAGSVAIGLNGPFSGCSNYTVRGTGTDLMFNRPTGGDVLFRENNGSTQLRLRSGGVLQLVTLGTAGATALCRNASNDISTCSSSARYKDNINTFTSGLDLIRRLRPVSFNWKDGGMADMGLVAEEVNAVEPLLTSTNSKGQVEGVKYDRVGVVLVNAVKEQQAQIEVQQAQIDAQRATIESLERQATLQQNQIELLTRLVCSGKAAPEACSTASVPR